MAILTGINDMGTVRIRSLRTRSIRNIIFMFPHGHTIRMNDVIFLIDSILTHPMDRVNFMYKHYLFSIRSPGICYKYYNSLSLSHTHKHNCTNVSKMAIYMHIIYIEYLHPKSIAVIAVIKQQIYFYYHTRSHCKQKE